MLSRFELLKRHLHLQVEEGDDTADGMPSGSPASVEMTNGGAEHGQRHNALIHKTSGEVRRCDVQLSHSLC